ncbi:alpha-L-arabinofuranosidase C-terminal domain-containing protein [Xylanibacter rodentium]|uniref:non-reducing end alpha-L-arabinofuranosidase n=1 Tax=Xylanibacter rodentium TaxID=2736289 RepID=A0ABX2AX95_9BACT|nr:alpha-L-arabinofuranosidase C-terminal domain-containing protein [Xylanibacter rodentium]NPE12618.1 alpha-L-arabinofuranosidase [Prevotella sp. PJ1A]NPE15109.1 alpha-L-arabinofuranosidase [Xylanibacter rodentium]NPE40048.1 alpha-L-arabinofuranosidase [Prevotella sp. PCJ2]
MNHRLLTYAFAITAATSSFAQHTHVMDVNTKKAGATVQNTMYGLFFEDINYAADGGLYGELVKNRSFEFPQSFMGWQTFGNVELKADGPFERCPHYVVLSDPQHVERRTGLVNEGYFGIGVEKGEEYRFTVWAKAPKGSGRITVQLINPATMGEHQDFASVRLDVKSAEWQKYEVRLKANQTNNKAQLRIFLDGRNTVCLEHVSLFPVNTFKGRDNGMRRDLAQALADVHPGVFRFPGGCIVEGTDLATRYQWKNTIGPVENRPINGNRWQHTFTHRFFPDYYQSYGLGFFEYFQLSEDIGAEPLPVLNVGMSCQFQNRNNAKWHVPVNELKPYIDDCLDLIEFANGDTTTTWGRKRAEMGHPAPFNLKIIGVGNEQWDTLYFERLAPFVKAIKAKHPDIMIVGTSGPDSEGKMFEIGWKAMKELKADLVDEHFYRNEEWFLKSGLRYDNYDRKGPKVFAGEYACHGKGKKWNHYEASIYEAAFMTDMERNADVVWMTAYAPLFAHVEGWQWRPDLIWYDNTRIFKSVSYYVQQMYAMNRGTNVLPMTMDGKFIAGREGQDGLFASSVVDKNDGTVIVKVINTSKTEQPVTINLNGLTGATTAATITLSHNGPDDENTLDQPEKITPKNGTVSLTAGKKASVIQDKLAPLSFRLYKVKK